MKEPPSETPSTKEVDEHPWRVVWALAWPAVALNSLQVVNALLDTFFVGHLSTASLTAYGGMTPILFLMFSFAMAIGTAATALVSRAFGANEVGEYRQAARQSVSLSLLGGLLFTVICLVVAGPASAALLPEENKEAAKLMADFVRIYAAGLPAIFLIQCLAGALRGAGDTKSPMMISGLQILMHIALNMLLINKGREYGILNPAQLFVEDQPRFIFTFFLPGANMGLLGAATALSGSAWIAAVIYLGYSGKTELGAQYRVEIPKPDWVRRIVRIAVPATVMSLLRVGSLTAFQLALKYVPNGSSAIAAMRPSFNIESIMFMPAFGLSMAAAALVGQSLGAKRPDRAEKLAWTAAHMGALLTITLCGPIFIAAPWIGQQLLGDKPEVVAASTSLLRNLCATEVFFAYAMVLIGAMQGAGDTKRPLWLTIANLWGVRVPLAYFLALAPGVVDFVPYGLGWGAVGAWVAMSVSQATQGITTILVFKRGTWKFSRV